MEASSDQSMFVRIGGEQSLRALVDRFYDLMALDERYADIRALHPPDLDSSRDKLFWFLCGWTGGPSHYIERFGHPRLRARHLPYAIGIRERDAWLSCMRQAITDCGIAPDVQARLSEAFEGTADWMRNRPG